MASQKPPLTTQAARFGVGAARLRRWYSSREHATGFISRKTKTTFRLQVPSAPQPAVPPWNHGATSARGDERVTPARGDDSGVVSGDDSGEAPPRCSSLDAGAAKHPLKRDGFIWSEREHICSRA
ncbi:unnamed protein product [Lampetra fluviatilis]